MRETHQPPTTSPAGPPHDHTYPRHSCTHPRHDHPRLRHSHTQPRHSREGGNPPRCIHTPKEPTILPPSTKFDKTRQNPTRFYRNSCPHAREATDVPFPFSRHGSFPGRSGLDVPPGVAVP